MTLRTQLLVICFIVLGDVSFIFAADARRDNLTLSDLYLDKVQFLTLSESDQINYLSAILFLTTAQDQIYSLNQYESRVTTALWNNRFLHYPTPTNYTFNKLQMLSRSFVAPAHALLPALLARLALTAPVRTQLMRLGVTLAKGATRVTQILQTRAISASVAKVRNQILNLQQARAKLVSAQAKAMRRENSNKLSNIKSELSKIDSELNIASTTFLKNGGTVKQLEAVFAEGAKSRGLKLAEFTATGAGIYGVTELADHVMHSGRSDQTAPVSSNIPGKMQIGEQYRGTEKKEQVDPNFCLFGLYPSEKNNQNLCREPKQSRSKSCKRSEFLCPTLDLQLKDAVVEKDFCIERKPYENLSQRCLDRLLSALNKLGQSNTNLDATWSAEKALELYTLLLQSKMALVEKSFFAAINPASKARIGDYCAAQTVSNNVNQKAECAAIDTLFEAIDKTKASDLVFSRRSAGRDVKNNPAGSITK